MLCMHAWHAEAPATAATTRPRTSAAAHLLNLSLNLNLLFIRQSIQVTDFNMSKWMDAQEASHSSSLAVMNPVRSGST